MSELEDKINSILSNPEELEKISAIAKSFMSDNASGGGSEGGGHDGHTDGSESGGLNLGGLDLGSIDPNTIAMLGRLMSKAGDGGEKHTLLEAMKPYLSRKRRDKMDRAVQIAKMARLAGVAFSEFGGGSNE